MFYQKLGNIPQKRHIQFRKPDGTLYAEELISTEGLYGILSNVYHINLPPNIDFIEPEREHYPPKEENSFILKPYHLKTKDVLPKSDFVYGRSTLFFNDDVEICLCKPKLEMTYFYKNVSCDELVFVHEGSGTLETNLGNLDFHKGDYIVIPRNVLYQMKSSPNSRFLIFEANGPIKIPQKYRNEFGQFLEHSPYCERDIRIPTLLNTKDEKGDYTVKIKRGYYIYTMYYSYHPFDIVGWDGYYYPWIFNIEDFMPITGKIHQPFNVHQTFEGAGFNVNSFVSRLLDYHPLAIPLPYNHTNVDMDEMTYYVEGQFSGHKGIESGSVTMHPSGIPHGPHSRTIDKSIGKDKTVETAIMVDTAKPLKLTPFSMGLSEDDYAYSWKK